MCEFAGAGPGLEAAPILWKGGSKAGRAYVRVRAGRCLVVVKRRNNGARCGVASGLAGAGVEHERAQETEPAEGAARPRGVAAVLLRGAQARSIT